MALSHRMDRTTVIAFGKQLSGVKIERFSDLANFQEIPNNCLKL
jgi:hypothetical protein